MPPKSSTSSSGSSAAANRLAGGGIWTSRPAVLVGWLLLAAVVGGGLWWGLNRPQARTTTVTREEPVARLERPGPAPEGYVGSAACAECHTTISQQYAAHPMAHSFFAVDQASPLEDYTEKTRFEPTPSRTYWVERQDGQVIHHEIGKDGLGEPVYDEAEKIGFGIGSGQRGRSYLLRRGDYLFMSPISWYSAQSRWDLSPQYLPESNRGFRRPANERCLLCHAGRMNYSAPPTSELAQRYGDPPVHEAGIGCERCHGPGERHVAYRRQHVAQGASADDPIVNPARLGPSRRDAVCNQCHLQGDAVVLRYGRLHGDFRPGNELGDIWTIFLQDTGVDDDESTRAVSQVEQMQSSACFTRSAGKLGCISCHDPHTLPAAAEAAPYYEAKCAQCHGAGQPECRLPLDKRRADPARRDCIACHMPRLPAADVPHTTQTDHRILRDPARPREKHPASGDEVGQRIFDLAECPLSEAELARAWGIRLSFRAESEVSKELAAEAEVKLRLALKAAPDDVEVLDALAICCVLQGRSSEATDLWRSVLVIEPNRQNALFSLGLLMESGGDPRQALVYLEQLLRLNPWQSDGLAKYSRALRSLNRFPEAIAAAERFEALNPGRADTYTWLRDLHQLNGGGPQVLKLEALIRRLRPDQPEQVQQRDGLRPTDNSK